MKPNGVDLAEWDQENYQWHQCVFNCDPKYEYARGRHSWYSWSQKQFNVADQHLIICLAGYFRPSLTRLEWPLVEQCVCGVLVANYMWMFEHSSETMYTNIQYKHLINRHVSGFILDEWYCGRLMWVFKRSLEITHTWVLNVSEWFSVSLLTLIPSSHPNPTSTTYLKYTLW